MIKYDSLSKGHDVITIREEVEHESSKSTAAQLFYVELRSKMDDFIRLTKSFYNIRKWVLCFT